MTSLEVSLYFDLLSLLSLLPVTVRVAPPITSPVTSTVVETTEPATLATVPHGTHGRAGLKAVRRRQLRWRLYA
jgi:hypothetical protein